MDGGSILRQPSSRRRLRPSGDAESNKPDCGAPDEQPFLSRRHAQQIQMHMSVCYWDEVTGSRARYPMSSSFGWHRFPLETWFAARRDPLHTAQEADNNGVLAEYGIGVVLYFKLVKSLMWIFLAMSVLSLPSIALYRSADTTSAADRAFVSLRPARLASITLAALGQPNSSCRRAAEGDVFSFRCPAGGTVRSVVAYFGQPRGSCSCPLAQQPPCPVCTPDRPACRPTTTRFGQRCCASSDDATDLLLTPNLQCNSAAAPLMLTHLCLGKTHCSLDIQANATLELLDYTGDRSVCLPSPSPSSSSSSPSSSSPSCSTSLLLGEWSGCSAAPLELLFEGICVQDQLGDYAHADLAQLAATLNALGVLVFLLGLLWIRTEQERDISALRSGVCRASDYTVLCRTAPFVDYFSARPDNKEGAREVGEGGGEGRKGIDYVEVCRTIASFFETSLAHCPSVLNATSSVKIADLNLTSTDHAYLDCACVRGSMARSVDRILNQFVAVHRNGRLLRRSKATHFSGLRNELREALLAFEQANTRCLALQFGAPEHITSAFLTFETEEGCLRCLQSFSDAPVLARRAADPSEIIWEHWGYSPTRRALRVCLASLALVLILALSYLLIFTLQYSGNNFSTMALRSGYCDTLSVRTERDPALLRSLARDAGVVTYDKVLWDHSPALYNRSDFGANGYLECFCKQLKIELGATDMKTYPFFNLETGKSEQWCSDVTAAQDASTLANYLTTLLIVTINILMRYSLQTLVRFERLETSTHEVVSYSLKLFTSQYINTALLALVIYNNLSQLAGASPLPILESRSFSLGFFSGLYSDFDYAWYAAVGTSLTFTMFFYTIGNFIRAQLRRSLDWLRVRWDMRRGRFALPLFDHAVSHLGSQTELDQMYVGPEFPLEILYGTLLAVVYVNMTYSSTMPVMNLLTLATLVLTYNVDKFFLLRYYRAPPVYAEFLPRMVTVALFGAGLVHCFLALWMFGNSALYHADLHHEDTWVVYGGQRFMVSTHSWQRSVGLADRLGNHINALMLVVTALLLLCVSTMLLNATIKRLFHSDVLQCILRAARDLPFVEKQRVASHPQQQPPYFDCIPLETLRFRMESGAAQGSIAKRYASRILELERRPELAPDKQLIGLESYNLSFSVDYTTRFGLNTRYMRRTQPKDWIVNRSNGLERRASAAMPDHLRRGSFGVNRFATIDLSDMAEVSGLYSEELQFRHQIDHLLRECAPEQGADGRWTMKRLSLPSAAALNLEALNASASKASRVYRYSGEEEEFSEAARVARERINSNDDAAVTTLEWIDV